MESRRRLCRDPHRPASGRFAALELVEDLALEPLRLVGHEGTLHPLENDPDAGPAVEHAVKLGVGAVSNQRREPGFACVANLSGVPVPLIEHTAVLLASGPLTDGLLPPDTTVWLRTDRPL